MAVRDEWKVSVAASECAVTAHNCVAFYIQGGNNVDPDFHSLVEAAMPVQLCSGELYTP